MTGLISFTRAGLWSTLSVVAVMAGLFGFLAGRAALVADVPGCYPAPGPAAATTYPTRATYTGVTP